MKKFILKVLDCGFEISFGGCLIFALYVFVSNVEKIFAMNLKSINWLEINEVTSLVIELVILLVGIILLALITVRLLKKRKQTNVMTQCME